MSEAFHLLAGRSDRNIASLDAYAVLFGDNRAVCHCLPPLRCAPCAARQNDFSDEMNVELVGACFGVMPA